MWVCAAAVACAAAALVSGCGDGGSPHTPALGSAVVEKGSAVAAPKAPPMNAAPGPGPYRDGYPPCPASDAWGKDPLGRGVLVTVWSDHPDSVTVLVRTSTGVDRARTGWIGPDDEFRLFDFPDVDYTTVAGVLILTNSRSCYSLMDPATAAG